MELIVSYDEYLAFFTTDADYGEEKNGQIFHIDHYASREFGWSHAHLLTPEQFETVTQAMEEDKDEKPVGELV